MNIRQKIFLVLTIVCMVGIFMFSARTGSESTTDSYRLGYAAGRLLHSDFDQWENARQLSYVEGVDHGIRKTAHAGEYGLLAALVALTILPKAARKYMKYLLMAWGITTVYAMSDEFHQLFVPGRSGQVTDVLIDSSGAIVMLAFISLFLFLKNRKKVA